MSHTLSKELEEPSLQIPKEYIYEYGEFRYGLENELLLGSKAKIRPMKKNKKR